MIKPGKLVTLYLSDNLKFIPEEVFTMTNLVRLDLGWNHLEEISPRIGELSKIRRVMVKSKSIKDITSRAGKLRQIENIIFTGY